MIISFEEVLENDEKGQMLGVRYTRREGKGAESKALELRRCKQNHKLLCLHGESYSKHDLI